MWRKIRIVAFWGCLAASMAIAALWVRSYYARDSLVHYSREALSSPEFHFGIASWRGGLNLILDRDWEEAARVGRWGISSIPAHQVAEKDRRMYASGYRPYEFPTVFGFAHNYFLSTRRRYLDAPHWAFLIVTAGLAAAFKPAPRLKFTLRDLLIVTTLGALVAGAFAAVGRLAE